MADKTVSQPHNAALPADAFKKAMDEQYARWTQMLEESQKAQARWFEQGTRAIDEMSTLMKAGLKYQADLAADFQRLTADVAKKATELYPR